MLVWRQISELLTKIQSQVTFRRRGENWLRGLDLNQRPPGYEPQEQLARLCLSMTYVVAVRWCSTVFRGVLFPICSRSCSQNLSWKNVPPTELFVVYLRPFHEAV
jgi:hypothetical protein